MSLSGKAKAERRRQRERERMALYRRAQSLRDILVDLKPAFRVPGSHPLRVSQDDGITAMRAEVDRLESEIRRAGGFVL